MNGWIFDAIETPKMSWKCEVSGGWIWYFEEGQQPCWFHRKMQGLVLGLRWSRIDQKGEECDERNV